MSVDSNLLNFELLVILFFVLDSRFSPVSTYTQVSKHHRIKYSGMFSRRNDATYVNRTSCFYTYSSAQFNAYLIDLYTEYC